MKHAIYIATRSPFGQLTGRKAVIKTQLKYLQTRFSSLTLLSFEDIDNPETICNHYLPLKRPGLIRVLFNIFSYFLLGKKSINECLYYNPHNFKLIKKRLGNQRFNVAFFDMLRTGYLARSINYEISVMDLDDLLSNRYKQYIEDNISLKITLGYYNKYIPNLLIPFGKLFTRCLLLRELSILSKKEVNIPATFDIVSLVSPKECKNYYYKTSCPAHSFPMAFAEGCNIFGKSSRKEYFVFLGGLNYSPNYEGIKWLSQMYKEHTELRTNFRIYVIGAYEEQQLLKLDQIHFKYLGYIEDIDTIIKHSKGLIAPIISGTGVKTKIVECMSKGVPIITTDLGMEGIEYEDGINCLIFNDAASLASVLHVASNPTHASKLSSGAFLTYKRQFSESVVFNKWDNILASAK
jgi:glycosyltransferase involved in cell wall biosynthesis